MSRRRARFEWSRRFLANGTRVAGAEWPRVRGEQSEDRACELRVAGRSCCGLRRRCTARETETWPGKSCKMSQLGTGRDKQRLHVVRQSCMCLQTRARICGVGRRGHLKVGSQKEHSHEDLDPVAAPGGNDSSGGAVGDILKASARTWGRVGMLLTSLSAYQPKCAVSRTICSPDETDATFCPIRNKHQRV